MGIGDTIVLMTSMVAYLIGCFLLSGERQSRTIALASCLMLYLIFRMLQEMQP